MSLCSMNETAMHVNRKLFDRAASMQRMLARATENGVSGRHSDKQTESPEIEEALRT